ncbi:histidine kinase [Streptomyces sp. NPDC003077]|uniref:sensor histidine kinase n=1 Tax=Streptomyces sp. NPDC003077 TaxID=3154443 RepID=UPI0033A048EC
MDTQEHPPSSGVGRRRRRWTAAVAALVLAPAIAAPPSTWTTAVMAALTVAVAMLPWRAGRIGLGRIGLGRAAGGVAALSLVADLAYFGRPGLVLLWLPVETAALLVLLYRAIRHLPAPRVAAVTGGLTGAAVLALPLRMTLHAPHLGLKESVFVVALSLFPAAGATGVGLYLRSLDGRRARAVALARREQRLEVARDLHDFVAHEVTGIVLEAQAGQLEADGAGPDEHRALLVRIEQAGLRALDSMDQTVRALREADGRKWGEPPPTRLHGLADLPELVGRFSSMAASEVDLSLEDGVADTLSREAEDTAYRVVLESLTNVRRHAPQAGRVTVFAGRTADRAVEIAVTDDAGPSAPAPTRHGGGTGLAGLAERVSTLGGTLEAGPHEKGWRVRCVLPAPALR